MITPNKLNRGNVGSIALFLVSAFALIGTLFVHPLAPVPTTPSITVGAALPSGVAVFETALQSPITSTATSMTLAANAVSGGSVLSGYNCFTIDEGSSQAEYVCGTVSGTNVTGLTRGIDPITATTTNATLQFAHRRGADVKVTDYPLIQILRNQLNGNDTIPNVIAYTSGTGCVTNSASNTLCDKNYIDTRVIAGAPNATELVNGISQLATGLQAASSTSNGSTGARLVIPSSLSTSTPGSVGLWNVMTLNDGNISPLFVDGSSEIYSFNGGTMNTASSTDSATTTIAASSVTNKALVLNGIPYQAPSTQGAAGTVLTNNGSGIETWSNPPPAARYVLLDNNSFTENSGTFATSTLSLTIPANVMTASSTIGFTFSGGVCSGTSSDCQIYIKNIAGASLVGAVEIVTNTSVNAGQVTGWGTVATGNQTNFQSQNWQVTSQYTNSPSGVGTSVVLASNGSSAIDFTVPQTFKVVIQGQGGANFTLNQYSLIVNP